MSGAPERAGRLPATVTLRAIEYSVAEREGSVIFTETMPVWGQGTRLHFFREIDGGGWCLTSHGDSDKLFMPHVVEAYRMIVGAYGDGAGRKSL